MSGPYRDSLEMLRNRLVALDREIAAIEEGFSDDDQSVEYMRMPVNVTLEKIPESKNRYGTFLPVVQTLHPLLRQHPHQHLYWHLPCCHVFLWTHLHRHLRTWTAPASS